MTAQLCRQFITIPTYPIGPAEANPLFYSGRVYQGARGRVYPYPMLDRLSQIRQDRTYAAMVMENPYLRLMVLPELGGRIFEGLDKTNGYDFFYRQHVIKPALVGMLGAWISGGAEWDLPHHHRATTFMPVHCHGQTDPDGGCTVTVGETELHHRMGWSVAVTLRPDRSYVQTTIRMVNRTPLPQSMLCFTNTAVPCGQNYQVVFPPRTQWGTGHSKCGFLRWPIADGKHGSEDLGGLDLSWWKNHRSPRSIFAWNYEDDFFGGYDHDKSAGVVHVADHHVVPGKKFFLFSGGPGGQMWDKVLTDTDGPYLELMAGAYSDNQPDYSWIAPYETKVVTAYWYPLRELGGIKNATMDAAVNVRLHDGQARVAFNATGDFPGARAMFVAAGRPVLDETIHISPDRPYVKTVVLPPGIRERDLLAVIADGGGRELVRWQGLEAADVPKPPPVLPPGRPEEIKTNEELYLAGLRLEQFHNPTLDAESYYLEALRRDADDARTNLAMATLNCRRGLYDRAIDHLRRSLGRVGANYTSPRDGEPLYLLGVSLRAQGQRDKAVDAFRKACWSFAWRAAGYCQLAEMAMEDGCPQAALDWATKAVVFNADHAKARTLAAMAMRKLGLAAQAAAAASQIIAASPLDFWARNEQVLSLRQAGKDDEAQAQMLQLAALMQCSPATGPAVRHGHDVNTVQSFLELAGDYISVGQWTEAIEILERLSQAADQGLLDPMVHYTLGYCFGRQGQTMKAGEHFAMARRLPPTYCFPFRQESAAALRAAIEHDPGDARALYYLGNLLFEHRPQEAVLAWENSAKADPSLATVHRNLALAYQAGDVAKATASMERAAACDPSDARILAELDGLLQRQGVPHAQRLERLERHHATVALRDDALLKEIRLLLAVGRYDRAIELFGDHHFHTWEGFEGTVHNTYVDAHLLRGCSRLKDRQLEGALADFQAALEYPDNLEMGRPADGGRAPQVMYYVGRAMESLGRHDEAREAYSGAAASPRAGTPLAYYQAMALKRLGRTSETTLLVNGLLNAGEKMLSAEATADFFSKFGEERGQKHQSQGHYLLGLGLLGQDKLAEALEHFRQAVDMDMNNLPAQNMLHGDLQA